MFYSGETLSKIKNSLCNSLKRIMSQQIVLNKLLKTQQDFDSYAMIMNQFYQKIFELPKKLSEQHEKQLRLKDYLQKIKLLLEIKTNTLYGIHLPIFHESNIVCCEIIQMVNILITYCRIFQTKQRVPYKLVVQTISLQDLQLCLKNQKLLTSSYKFPKNKSLILPQSYFGQWSDQLVKIQSKSIYSGLSSYRVKCFLVKSGDDMRQQYLAMQIITLMFRCIQQENLKIWIKPYLVIPYNQQSAMIQFLNDTHTVSKLKQVSNEKSLRKIYKQIFGENWQLAITNFVRSLAGYSLLQYLFQIKDRHNNNILIDSEGHLIHIDFSLMLKGSPGNLNFQQAPFKLTYDYLQMMEGLNSQLFQHFKFLVFTGLKYIRKYENQFISIILAMGNCSNMKCLTNLDINLIKKRFHLDLTDEQLNKIVDQLISDALGSYSTDTYDLYQWFTNDIHS